MQSLIIGVVTWLAANVLPADWIKRQVTAIVTRLLTRLFEYASRLAANTTVTDLDDKAVAALRERIMAEGMIAHLVDVVYSLLTGKPIPAPVDPLNPPTPTPEPQTPGIFRRLWNGIKFTFRG